MKKPRLVNQICGLAACVLGFAGLGFNLVWVQNQLLIILTTLTKGIDYQNVNISTETLQQALTQHMRESELLRPRQYVYTRLSAEIEDHASACLAWLEIMTVRSDEGKYRTAFYARWKVGMWFHPKIPYQPTPLTERAYYTKRDNPLTRLARGIARTHQPSNDDLPPHESRPT
jgi:hypothetical protein